MLSWVLRVSLEKKLVNSQLFFLIFVVFVHYAMSYEKYLFAHKR